MKAQVVKHVDRIRSSFWFLPALMAGGAMLLASVAIKVDELAREWLVRTWGWAFEGGAEGASSVLATVAASMITTAGVVFSITLVALTLTSSQFGPRLLRNFMRDTTTKVVLGTFVATFLYCLLVLRSIRRPDEVAFVPHLAVLVGVVLAVLSVGVLIYFIHHISLSIQADQIVRKVGEDLDSGIDRLYPDRLVPEGAPVPNEPSDAALSDSLQGEARPVVATKDGYVQSVDEEALVKLAAEADLVIRVERRPGNYAVRNHPLVLVWPGERVTEEVTNRIGRAFALGGHRTHVQDLEFILEQLVEVAVRALSPGVNDPFTAIRCVDRLGAGLSRLVRRKIPSSYHRDEEGRLRVVAPVPTFPELTDAAFNQIRQYGTSSVAVTLRLLETIGMIGAFVPRSEDRAALRRQADMIVRGAREEWPEEDDLQAAEARYGAALEALKG